jgi:soluble lytic murein transglycosylase-like protein
MRRRGRAPAVWVAAVVALVVAALGACDAQVEQPTAPRGADTPSGTPSGTPESASPPQSGSPTPSGSPTVRRDALAVPPTIPTRPSAGTLAGQVTAAERVLRDPDSPGRDVRRAAEFEQLAARLLATAPEKFRRAVLIRLGPSTRAKTRLDVQAASLLDAMTSPEPRLPEWRIVAPPPAQVLLGHYRFASRRIGVPWNYLAAIHLVETRMGRIRGVSSAGARGPMQFLPATWALYGEGGDIDDPRDAILAAARLLRANGAPDDMAEAVRHYNPSNNYVGAVTRYAEAMKRSPLAYRGYWHWRVLYKHVRGTYVLERGYPDVRARLLR